MIEFESNHGMIWFKKHGVDDYGNIPFNTVVFTPHMQHLCGKTATIVDLAIGDEVEVWLEFEDRKVNGSKWCYVTQMLEHIN